MEKKNQAASAKATQQESTTSIIPKKSRIEIHEEHNGLVRYEIIRGGLRYCKDPDNFAPGQFIRSKYFNHNGDGFFIKERVIDFIVKTKSSMHYVKTAACSTKDMGTSIRRHFFYCLESDFPMQRKLYLFWSQWGISF